jgi:hypothetical protein
MSTPVHEMPSNHLPRTVKNSQHKGPLPALPFSPTGGNRFKHRKASVQPSYDISRRNKDIFDESINLNVRTVDYSESNTKRSKSTVRGGLREKQLYNALRMNSNTDTSNKYGNTSARV